MKHKKRNAKDQARRRAQEVCERNKVGQSLDAAQLSYTMRKLNKLYAPVTGEGQHKYMSRNDSARAASKQRAEKSHDSSHANHTSKVSLKHQGSVFFVNKKEKIPEASQESQRRQAPPAAASVPENKRYLNN